MAGTQAGLAVLGMVVRPAEGGMAEDHPLAVRTAARRAGMAVGLVAADTAPDTDKSGYSFGLCSGRIRRWGRCERPKVKVRDAKCGTL